MLITLSCIADQSVHWLRDSESNLTESITAALRNTVSGDLDGIIQGSDTLAIQIR